MPKDFFHDCNLLLYKSKFYAAEQDFWNYNANECWAMLRNAEQCLQYQTMEFIAKQRWPYLIKEIIKEF